MNQTVVNYKKPWKN